MKRFFLLLTTICLLALLSVYAQAAAPFADTRALFVPCGEGGDFPSNGNLSAKALRGELEEICTYAKQAGYNAIAFEIRPEGGALYHSPVFDTSRFLVRTQGDYSFFDPLGELIKLAMEQELTVYAVVDPYSGLNSADVETVALNVRDLTAVTRQYRTLGGLLLTGLERAPDGAASLLGSLRTSLGEEVAIGALLAQQETDVAGRLTPDLDYLSVRANAFTGFAEENFVSVLHEWQDLSDLPVIVFVDTADPEVPAEESAARVLAAGENGAGCLVGGYRFLRDDRSFAGSLIASMQNISATEVYTPPYAPAQSLTVTRPAQTLTTSYDAYFIMGTSDPDLPLTLDGETVDRQTTNGVFGVLVELENGTNTFSLRQGSEERIVTIIRPTGKDEADPVTTTRITSMTPDASLIAWNGETIAVTCVAPANMSITATFGGKTIALEQRAAAKDGVPAAFSGEFTVSGAGNGQVLDLGAITYEIVEYGTEFESAGHVFAVGEGGVPTVTVNTTSASVFYDEQAQAGNFKAIYKMGVTDRVLGATDTHYRLFSGYIKKSDVDVNVSDAPAEVSVTAIETAHDETAERFILRGANGLPYSFADQQDGSIDLTLYGISLPEQIDTTSEIFSEIAWTDNGDDTVTAHFIPMSAHGVWALDVFPSQSGTVIYARRTPKLSDVIGKPLTGLTLVLDPGHGGNDSGALSTLGDYESDLNFAEATQLKYRLEQLGAAVVLTRTATDETVSLYERVGVGQEVLPDFFISLHHNSVVEFADAYNHRGVEAYYYEGFGKALCEAAVEHISRSNYDRAYRTAEWGYYVVTKNRFAPSILCEIGFMPNPVESRYIADHVEINKTANALCTAVMEVVRRANEV